MAALLAVLAAGVAGGVFSPIAGRLKGAYLGIATLALIFVGQHVLFNAEPVTGGYNGRAVPPMELFGFAFADTPSWWWPRCRSVRWSGSGSWGWSC